MLFLSERSGQDNVDVYEDRGAGIRREVSRIHFSPEETALVVRW